jgi:hypothetical protein
MSLPELTESGDLPAGIHPASLDEVVARFGQGTAQRQAVTDRLRKIHRLALANGSLDQLIIFGSYVSDQPAPNDVDVILVMRNDFRSESCPTESSVLFDHARADVELGASVFWVRPDMLLGGRLNSSWLSGRRNAMGAGEVLWRYDHDPE